MSKKTIAKILKNSGRKDLSEKFLTASKKKLLLKIKGNSEKLVSSIELLKKELEKDIFRNICPKMNLECRRYISGACQEIHCIYIITGNLFQK